MRYNNPTFNQCLAHLKSGGEVKIEKDYNLGDGGSFDSLDSFLHRFPDVSFYESEFDEGWKRVELVIFYRKN